MELHDEVAERHVQEALRLMKVSMQQSAMDHRTGMIDMDKIYSGVGAFDREMRRHLSEVIGELLNGALLYFSSTNCCSRCSMGTVIAVVLSCLGLLWICLEPVSAMLLHAAVMKTVLTCGSYQGPCRLYLASATSLFGWPIV